MNQFCKNWVGLIFSGGLLVTGAGLGVGVEVWRTWGFKFGEIWDENCGVTGFGAFLIIGFVLIGGHDEEMNFFKGL